LNIPSSQYIISKEAENLETCLCARDTAKNQYWIPHDLQVLGLHVIKSGLDSGMEITAWAQKLLQKSLSVNTVCCAIHTCRVKLSHRRGHM